MHFPVIHPIAYEAPVEIVSRFTDEENMVFLDSAKFHPEHGRYSYIAVDPFLILQSKNGHMQVNGEVLAGNPFHLLKKHLATFTLSTSPDYPPFQGGAAGYLGYDLYQHLEKIPMHAIDDMSFKDMIMCFYDLVIAFDNEIKKAWIFSSGFPLQTNPEREQHAKDRIEWLLSKIASQRFPKKQIIPVLKEKDIQSNVTQQDYEQSVSKTINYIRAGDIFEACLSQRFKTTLPSSLQPFDLYKRLRSINPAPFSAYLKYSDIVIASASPERFLKAQQKNIETRPIKGTRPRGKTLEEDKQLANELLSSEKDHAENVMIVDLLRNDLSRVCEPNSIHVPQLCGLESYANVHHIVSVVKGKLKKDNTVIDLLEAAFPGGSITGAPKIRAMEIIAEIEPYQRGPYCGSVAFIGFNGDMDTSILIRTYTIKGDTLTYQTGGAVVLDSDPDDEYQETLAKASALKRALIYDTID